MHIVTISWVRNEADVIEAFVRHHCAFADRMIIVDHRSQDDTGNILQRLKDEGLPLDLRSDHSFIHRQGEAMTDLLRELRQEEVGIVIPLDADEFLCTTEGSSPRPALEAIPQDITTFVPWRTYVPLPEDLQEERNILRRITHRRLQESPQWHKVIIPGKLLHMNAKMDMGSHALVDDTTKTNVKHTVSPRLFLAHFPVRSAQQITGKVFGGWLSHVANPKRMPGSIFQWKAIFDQVKHGGTVDAVTLKNMALDYATERQWQALPEEAKGKHTLKKFVAVDPSAAMPLEVIRDPVLSLFLLLCALCDPVVK